MSVFPVLEKPLRLILSDGGEGGGWNIINTYIKRTSNRELLPFQPYVGEKIEQGFR